MGCVGCVGQNTFYVGQNFYVGSIARFKTLFGVFMLILDKTLERIVRNAMAQ